MLVWSLIGFIREMSSLNMVYHIILISQSICIMKNCSKQENMNKVIETSISQNELTYADIFKKNYENIRV